MRFFNYILAFILFTTLFSCKKLDYEDGIVPFGEVYFDMNKTAISNYLKIKYNGHPIDTERGTNGRVRVPQGESKFEFYDERNGTVLLEKVVNIDPALTEHFTLFQPSEDDPIAFLDPNGEDGEPASPDGFMKIKIANYSKELIPFENVDVILNFRYTVGRQYVYVPVDTIESVGQTLDTASYRLVNMGERELNYQPGYFLSFKEHGANNTEVQNAGGTMYYSHIAIIPDEERNVFTRYLTPVEYVANNLYIMNNDIYYYIDIASVYD
jgi:hypothetical protein